MDFTNSIFWISLIPALLLLALINLLARHHDDLRRRVHKVLLLLLSLSLLGMVSWQTLCIFVVVMHLAYGICRLGHNKSPRVQKFLLVLAIPLLLLPLAYYKYAYFISSAVMGTEWSALKNLIIPVGISFYSFQLAGFCIDTLTRGLPIPKYLDYMNFGAFFPQIVAGPIERRDNLLPQMEGLDLRFNAEDVNIGLRFTLLGLFFKMVLSDNLALGLAIGPGINSALRVWLNSLLFGFRIYFDFCGYALCALGVARCLGIRLTLNFLSPNCSCSMSDFWRRWHVSLTTWFRDYIYFPMKGSRTKFWAFNILFVFALSGLWHGSNWNYMIWGTLIGITLVVHRLWNKAGMRLYAPLAFALTVLCSNYIWMYFYQTDISELLHYNKLLITPASYHISLLGDMASPQNAAAAIALVLSLGTFLLEYLSIRLKSEHYALLISTPACVAWVALLLLFTPGVHNQFIYFAF